VAAEIEHNVRLTGEGLGPAAVCDRAQPGDVPEARGVLATARGAAIPRGEGRSYGDPATCDGGLVIDTRRMRGITDFDEAAGQVTCEAGATLEQVIDHVLPRGWFPAVTPGTRRVSIGGCIAADVHGKNHHVNGSFGEHVHWLDLLLPDGTEHRVGPDLEPELFDATLGGMGLTGLILRARLQLHRVESAYIHTRYVRASHVDELLDAFDQGQQARYSVAWIDGLARGRSLGRGVLILGEHALADELAPKLRDRPLQRHRPRVRRVPVHAPPWLLNRLSIRAFNEMYYRRNPTREAVEPYDAFFHPLDVLLHWNRLYGRRGFIQYQPVVPLERGRVAIRQMLELISGAGAASFLAVLKRMGPAGRGWLGFGQPGYSLAMDLPRTRGLPALVKELDAVVLDHGGRVYLAKDSMLDPPTFRAMYPQHERLVRLRERIDPDHRMASDLSRRVGLTPASAGPD
jgi:FAD/FMN-containing dehydrogenase